ncbi:TonB family protein [Ensifer adhaerens]|uniref:energy transducer TonB family protein n=1 Tax=Ensifer adhaerens TaxID=106592 RepID=UPI001CBFD662|nr:TonB family protein [Ensifer adhaerens]MBZ7922849.1 TonB family protein [Ensifer adhaerens]UAX91451.1 TonB family protein [Ensifer adhaerens]UAX99079.1 TonB family protein [Ensifer adhaerens]UAY06462.1 TonB family protein [Ensifer adhaerens]
MKRIVIWTGAAVISLATHGVVLATLFGSSPLEDEPALTVGGVTTEVAILGDAFSETLQAGDPSEIVEPTEDVPDEVEPEEITPVEDTTSTTPEIVAEQPSNLIATEADVILPAEEMPTLQVAEAVVTASAAPAETVVPEEKPEVEEPKKEKVEKKEPVKKKKVTRKKAGDKGEQQQTQVKGQADGDINGNTATATGEGRAASVIGSAGEENYKGKVRAKVQRVFLRKSRSIRRGEGDTVTVAFVVSANGSLASVNLVRSSGSDRLDKAAVDSVRSAAPFAAIPAGSGRSSWSFSVPMSVN